MNCYESLKITALLTVIFGVMCLPPCSGAANPQTRLSADYRRAAVNDNGDISRLTAAAADWSGGYEDIQCETVALAAAGGSSRYYLRNRCGSGLLSVDDRKKVVVQETGLTPGHPAAVIIKEVCSRRSDYETADAWKRRRRIEQSGGDEIVTVAGRQFVRYRHHASKRYVCFDRRGRVRAVIARKVEKRGLLCLFEEEQIDSSFHTIKSAFNPSWHLAFSNRRAFRQKYNGEKVLPSKRGFAANRGSCEAQFHSGHAEDSSSSHPSKASAGGHSFLGIFKQISKETGEENNTISSHNSQAHNYINNPSTTTINSQNKNSDKTVSEQFISSSRHISSSSISTTSRIYNKNQQHAVNLAVDNSIINDDISENKDDISSATTTEKSADSSSKQLITPSAAFAYPHLAVVRLQNAWAFAATASEQSQQLSVADNEINTNNSKPKIRHFAKKRPRPSRREKNRLKKKRRNRRGAQVARKFKAMNSA